MLFSNRSPNSSHHRIDVERQMSIVMRVRISVAVAVAIPVSISIGRMPICRVAIACPCNLWSIRQGISVWPLELAAL